MKELVNFELQRQRRLVVGYYVRLDIELSSMTHYFAEYLPRLKTTTVQVDLPKEKIESVEVRNDSILINSNTTVKLPSEVQVEKITHAVTAVSAGEASIRVREAQTGFLANESMETLLQDQYQWNVNNIRKYHTKDTFRCISCGAAIVELAEVTKFLPMPSELWYEMLDFWHCHKPTEENGSSSVGLLRKFNQLKPGRRSVIVGAYYFIVNPEDWPNLEVSGEQLRCRCCEEPLGELDTDIGNYKLLKWQLRVAEEQFEPRSYISLKLVEEMNYSAVRVFDVVDAASGPNDGGGSGSGRSMQVWCFGTGIDVCSDTLGVLKNCLKLLFRESGPGETAHTGEIRVEHSKPFADFAAWLEKINRSLPGNLREYNGWKIGYVPISE